jgi:hypothetical protein
MEELMLDAIGNKLQPGMLVQWKPEKATAESGVLMRVAKIDGDSKVETADGAKVQPRITFLLSIPIPLTAEEPRMSDILAVLDPVSQEMVARLTQ